MTAIAGCVNARPTCQARAWSGGDCSGRFSESMSVGPPDPRHRRGCDTASVRSEDGWLVSESGGADCQGLSVKSWILPSRRAPFQAENDQAAAIDVVVAWSCEAVLKSDAGRVCCGPLLCFEHEDWIRRSCSSHGVAAAKSVPRRAEARAMRVETGEPEIIERVAALDVGRLSWCAASGHRAHAGTSSDPALRVLYGGSRPAAGSQRILSGVVSSTPRAFRAMTASRRRHRRWTSRSQRDRTGVPT